MFGEMCGEMWGGVRHLEVAEDDGDLGACDEEDEDDEGEEAEDVVEALEPHRRHDEEELDEDGPKGEDAAHEDVERPPHVPRLHGDLARDLVGAHLRRVTEASAVRRAC